MSRHPYIKALTLTLVIIFISAFGFHSLAQKPDGKIRFTILQLNDVYEITEVSGAGGLARVATLKQRLKKNNPNTYLFLAGDLFNPSALGTAKVDGERLAGKQMVAIMNQIPLDYMTFGNHEFDFNEEQFKKRMEESKWNWVSSNTKDAQGQSFPNVPENRIIEVSDGNGKSIKIGLIGLTLDSNKKPYVTYSNPIDTARKQLEILKEQNTEVIIAITHLAIEDDVKLSLQFPEIDLLIGGHEHTFHEFHRRGSPSVYKADANARTAYIHYFAYDPKTKSLVRNSVRRNLDTTIPDNLTVKAEVTKWVKIAFDGFRRDGFNPEKVVGKTNVVLDGTEASVTTKATNLTKLIADGILRDIPEAELGIFNAGSIRIDDTIPAGTLTEYDVIRILPYGGKLVLIDIKGEFLHKVLTQGVANKGAGGFLQVSGGEYDAQNQTWKVKGVALDTSRTYKVAVLDFLLTGREQNLEYFKRDDPNITVIKEGKDIRHSTIAQIKAVFK